MVRAELNDKDMEVTMRGNICAVVTEIMWLVKNAGEQLEKVTGVPARTHIVNMCKLVVEDKMTLAETMELAEKTMAGKEDPPEGMAATDKITELQDRLVKYLREDMQFEKLHPGCRNVSYISGWNNALCWVLHLTGKLIDLNEFTL